MVRLAVIGSTGSIGTQTLKIVRSFPGSFKVTLLAAGTGRKLLQEQAQEFKPEKWGLAGDITVRAEDFAATDTILIAAGGFAALPYVLAAAAAGKRIALANKEALVAAGGIITDCVKKHGAEIIPVDSEHSAIFQCLCGATGDKRQDLRRVILTASGGPLLNASPSELRDVKPERVVKHPRWNMGKKISVDSATMMNKGLEVIEAHHLFGLGAGQIDVVIHPESIVHSMVEFIDGSVLAQMSYPDMAVPIAHALFYPRRCPDTGTPFLDFNTLGGLRFMPLDAERFPCYGLALRALEKGGIMPCALNAANEAAVSLFLRERISYPEIPEIIGAVTAKYEANVMRSPDLNDIIRIDGEIKEYINKTY